MTLQPPASTAPRLTRLLKPAPLSIRLPGIVFEPAFGYDDEAQLHPKNWLNVQHADELKEAATKGKADAKLTKRVCNACSRFIEPLSEDTADDERTMSVTWSSGADSTKS